VSGELFRNNRDLSEGYLGKENIDISMDSVSGLFCPSELCEYNETTKYGTVQTIQYYSESIGCTRPAKVLIPADYDETHSYSVLYFLHGIFGDENSMVGDPNNNVVEILGNLRQEGFIGDVIVVFPNMYATADKNLKPGFTEEQTEPYNRFIDDLTQDLIPFIEERYSVDASREARGLIGFSMGGRESLYIGLQRSDLFECIGCIAPAPGVIKGKDWAMDHPGQLLESEMVLVNKESVPKLFMICCGTDDGVVGSFPKTYHEILVRNGVNHLWYEIPGADHDHNAVKSGLFNFLIRWFA